VHPDVPDLDPYLAAATVAVAPMPTGSGVPMKVLEAWAAGIPVVANPAAAEGLERTPEVGLELAGSSSEWVAALVRLLTEPAAASLLGARGRAVWERHYSPVRVRQAIRSAVAEAVSPNPGRPVPAR
jgi:glycosyltransferase involved in cell wall biosynthesis